MARAKQQISRFDRSVKKLMENVTNKKTMQKLADTAVEVIVKRTRGRGFGIDQNGGRLKKLKPVKPEYAKLRKKGDLHPEAAKGKRSNLTREGTLLDSLQPVKVSKKKAKLGWKKKKQRDVATGQEDQGRSFLFLSTKEVNLVAKQLEDKLAAEAKKI